MPRIVVENVPEELYYDLKECMAKLHTNSWVEFLQKVVEHLKKLEKYL